MTVNPPLIRSFVGFAHIRGIRNHLSSFVVSGTGQGRFVVLGTLLRGIRNLFSWYQEPNVIRDSVFLVGKQRLRDSEKVLNTDSNTYINTTEAVDKFAASPMQRIIVEQAIELRISEVAELVGQKTRLTLHQHDLLIRREATNLIRREQGATALRSGER